MRHLLASFFTLTLITTAADAAITRVACTVRPQYEYPADYLPVITKTCEDLDQATERCTAFAVHAKGKRDLVYRDAQAGIRTVDGFLEFKPVGMTSFDTRTPKGFIKKHWVVALVDNSGSPSRAEESFVVLEEDFKPIGQRMSYSQKEAYLKRQKISVGPLDEELVCKPAR